MAGRGKECTLVEPWEARQAMVRNLHRPEVYRIHQIVKNELQASAKALVAVLTRKPVCSARLCFGVDLASDRVRRCSGYTSPFAASSHEHERWALVGEV